MARRHILAHIDEPEDDYDAAHDHNGERYEYVYRQVNVDPESVEAVKRQISRLQIRRLLVDSRTVLAEDKKTCNNVGVPKKNEKFSMKFEAFI